MGSTVELLIGGATEAEELAEWAVGEVERLEQCWSRFRSDSELVRLNDRTGEWVVVSPTMALALRSAAHWWRETGGAFDPSVIGALERWGYTADFALVRTVAPTDVGVTDQAAPGLTGMASLQDYHTVRLPPGVRLDLGGIGKGLAADLVAEQLVAMGAPSVLISLGGDLRVAGAAPAAGYAVPVQDPFDPARLLFTHSLFEGALVTSTTRMRRWEVEGSTAHHLIDPATGRPADHGLAAVILAAPSCAQAEVLAKSVLVSGNVAGLVGRLTSPLSARSTGLGTLVGALAGTTAWTLGEERELRALPCGSQPVTAAA